MRVLVIAPRPNESNDLEGFQKRVAAIDEALRRKFQVSYFDDAASLFGRYKALYSADVIYVHSVYQAQRIARHLPTIGNRVILDIHGAVPDEERMAGNNSRAAETERIEATAFRYGCTFVAVSEAMVLHYQEKYRRSRDAKWIVLPIFESEKADASATRNPRKVIYIGGAQPWQQVDQMMEAIGAARGDFEFDIVTQSPNAFDKSLAKGKDVQVRTLASREVAEALAVSSMGFLLRDENVVNKVACPTKLIEYMTSGVVPIVLFPAIGDAQTLGYKYVTLSEFVAANPADIELAQAREANFRVLDKMRQQAATGLSQLIDVCEEIPKQSLIASTQERLGNVFAQFLFDNRLRINSYYRRLARFIRR
jgi:hypothetical protein